MPTFLVYDSERKKRWQVEVESKHIRLGRSKQADVPLPHVSVSKEHAVIEYRNGRFLFRDLGSRNGVFLNELRLKKGPLEDGDELRIGAIRLRFYRGKPPANATAPEQAASEDAVKTSGAEKPLDPGATISWIDEALSELDLAEKEKHASPKPKLKQKPKETRKERPRKARTREPETEARAHETPARRRRQWSPAVLAVILIVCLLLGLCIGLLLHYLRWAPEVGSRNREEATSQQGGPATASTVSDGIRFDSQSPLDDRVTSYRAATRLCLDLLGRPPIREELEALVALGHEDRWVKVQDWQNREGVALAADLKTRFERLIGRQPLANEHRALVEASGGDADNYAFLIVSSRYYASNRHRRTRSKEQLARSLVVDLKNRIPSDADTAKVLRPLMAAESSKDHAAVARAVAASRGDGARFDPDGDIDSWIVDAYARTVSRLPTSADKRRTLEKLQTGPSAWLEGVLLPLVMDPEYLEY